MEVVLVLVFASILFFVLVLVHNRSVLGPGPGLTPASGAGICFCLGPSLGSGQDPDQCHVLKPGVQVLQVEDPSETQHGLSDPDHRTLWLLSVRAAAPLTSTRCCCVQTVLTLCRSFSLIIPESQRFKEAGLALIDRCFSQSHSALQRPGLKHIDSTLQRVLQDVSPQTCSLL